MKIQAQFTRFQDAFNTLAKLKKQGYRHSHIPSDPFILAQNGEIDVPGSANAHTLSNLVLNSGDDTDALPSPLAAVNPMVSGMGGFEEITQDTYQLIVNVAPEHSEKVRHIIMQAGGLFH